MTNFTGDHEFVVQQKLGNPVTQYWEYGDQFFDNLMITILQILQKREKKNK